MKRRLIALMCAGLISTSPVVLTSCNTAEDIQNLTSALSADIIKDLTYCVYVFVENSTQDYYVSIIGHYASAQSNYTYLDHKDYRAIHKVSKEEYESISKFDNNSIDFLSKDEIKIIENIVKTYDPIDIVELATDNKCPHTFNEDYRFSEQSTETEVEQ